MCRIASLFVAFILLLSAVAAAQQVPVDPKPVDLNTELFLGPLKSGDKIDITTASYYLGRLTTIESGGKVLFPEKEPYGNSDKIVNANPKLYMSLKFEKGEIRTIGSTIYTIQTTSPFLKTGRGIKCGDNLMALIEAYGLPLRTNHFRSPWSIFTKTEKGNLFSFSSEPYVYFSFLVTDDAIIREITIGWSRS